jgi:hypothetical protein
VGTEEKGALKICDPQADEAAISGGRLVAPSALVGTSTRIECSSVSLSRATTLRPPPLA